MKPLNDADLTQLKTAGITAGEVDRQVAILAAGTTFVRLDRPATPGDGIRVVGAAESAALVAAFDAHRAGKQLAKFVPASGAASRMFKELVNARDALAAGEPYESDALSAFLEGVGAGRFAFGTALDAAKKPGDDGPLAILDALLGDDALRYAHLAKGLIPFHSYGDDARTPVEEHLAEAVAYATDAAGRGHLHFTVPPRDRERFEQLVSEAKPLLAPLLDVSFSVQEHHTDTVALDDDGELARDESGRLILRPGGHGALLENLQAIDADVVFVKNIDNVQHAAHAGATVRYKKVIGALLVQLSERAHALQARLDAGDDATAEAAAFLTEEFGYSLADANADAVRALLFRPIRVCGMVKNEGEPGGGPYWVAGDPASLQVVEAAQVDRADEAQAGLVSGATHFNPVDLACSFRDHNDAPYRLDDFVDHTTYFVASKSHAGRPIRALERPGLWNGAMAKWNTVFVEVSIETFSPAKTVNDLLRDAHQS
jgi:hypothetical protein